MTGSFTGGPRPNTTRHAGRQLTIGECIAISRYADSWAEGEPRRVDLDELLDFMDRVEVCTTCGWSVRTHMASEDHRRVVHCCAHHTREL